VWLESAPHPTGNWLSVDKPFAPVRLLDRIFHLNEAEDASVDPFYGFLARSNKDVPVLAFEFSPRAVHSFGRSDLVRKELIKDAAYRLLFVKTWVL
jgi:hypothetical protein